MYNNEAFSQKDRTTMIDSISIKSTEELFDSIPLDAKMASLNLDKGYDELEAQLKLKEISKQNNTDYVNFLGLGAKKRFVPSCINDVASRFEFLSCYTPYQAEISQGSLEIMYEFQSDICTLTNQDVSNATVYDGASACAEAILMSARLTKKYKAFVKDDINPNYLEVIKTYLWAGNIELVIGDDYQKDDICAKLYQSPNKYGEFIEPLNKNNNELIIANIDLMSYVLFEPPIVDITVGDIQSFGIGLNFGGAYAGFIACKDKYKRQLPGRIAGKTIDRNGKIAYCLTLQAREQHIRREKATSNICSNQASVAFCTNLYLRKLGKSGLIKIAQKSYENAHYLFSELNKIGFKSKNKEFFDEFCIELKNSKDFLNYMKQNKILSGIELDNNQILISATELNTKEELDKYIDLAKLYNA